MVTINQETKELKEKIIREIESFDYDKIKQIYTFVSSLAADNITKIADADWDEKSITRDKINKTITAYRKTNR